jgi:hypothetical protein
MSDEREAARRAAALRAGAGGEDVPKLSIKSKLKFLDLLAHGANSRELQMRMQLSPAEIAALKKSLNIVTPTDIKCRVNALENELNEERRKAMQETRVYEELSPHKRPEPKQDLPEGAVMKKNVPDLAHVHRNRRIKSINSAVDSIEDDSVRNFCIPDHEVKSFQLKLHLGVRWWANHYDVPTCIILKEILRLDPDIDLDMLNK